MSNLVNFYSVLALSGFSLCNGNYHQKKQIEVYIIIE